MVGGVLFCLFTSGHRPYQRLTLQSALSMGLASVEFISKGGYHGECINAKVTNLSGEAMSVSFEPGRILSSDDPGEQDLLLVDERELQLFPGDIKEIGLAAFCAQSSNNSPAMGSTYSPGRVDSGDVVALAKFLDDNAFPANATQHAIWAFTNGHDVIGIHHRDRDSTKKLLEFVCDLKDVPVPDVTLEYMASEHGAPFTDRATLVQVDFPCERGEETKVIFNLYDRKGSIVKRVVLPIVANCHKENHRVRMPVDDVEKGKYYLKAQRSGKGTLAEYAIYI